MIILLCMSQKTFVRKRGARDAKDQRCAVVKVPQANGNSGADMGKL
jgi:hypothetical protein